MSAWAKRGDSMKTSTAVTLVFLFLSMSLGGGEAAELFIDASQVATIRPSADSEDTHLLMKFALPESLAKKSADFACVEFEASCNGEKDVVSLEAFRVTTAWDAATVGWAEPWSMAGGDWDSDMSADWVVTEGGGKTVYLDVTDFVSAWLAKPSGNFGILVRVTEPFLGTLSTDTSKVPRLRLLY
jgi:hypothetical protein